MFIVNQTFRPLYLHLQILQGESKMHAIRAAQKSRRARLATEQLFTALRGTQIPSKDEPVRILYPTRFPTGKFIVAALVPIDDATMREFYMMCEAHRWYRHPPAIISNGDGRRLRLVWRFSELRSDEPLRLLELATLVAKWAKGAFSRHAVISPTGGLVATREMISLE